MKIATLIPPIVLFVCSAAISHFTMLKKIPRNVMQEIIDRTGQNGTNLNNLVHLPQITPAARRVPRPSPDLVYSICAYDLSDGDVTIEVSPQAEYYSLSLYDAQTNNFYVINDSALGEEGFIATITQNQNPGNDENAGEYIYSATTQGIALIRRLAATQALRDRSLAVRENDSCRSI